MSSDYHIPVMLREAMDGLDIWSEGVYVDVTFGGGGHSRAILERLGSEGRLFAFDQDADAQANAIDDPRFTLIGENFRYLRNYLRLYGVKQVDGVLADLGVSSHQIDTAGRGFSTRLEGELDMRMNSRSGITARQVVNGMEEGALAEVLRLYGELPNARQMARAIVRAREEKEIVSTGDLRDAVVRLLPRGRENKVLAMLFQALRIEVNGELDALREMMGQAIELLREPESDGLEGLKMHGGRLVVISYHSLEDRIVKNFMKSGNAEGVVEKDFYGNVLSPIKPLCRCEASDEEVVANGRARSARLRVGEKTAVDKEGRDQRR
ncbi:MAG: 16S rRNA (cytosine(1402)-N(4))-methyltransferase RsmH [Bacteroidales bacterium]|nr:16S rRNA (cytosine(1402)-N(4))-methyltransferase RsmH [Bacteroidales bacterium]